MKRVAYRPLRNISRLVVLISAIGVSFLLQDLGRFTEGMSRNAFYLTGPDLFKHSFHLTEGIILQEKSLIIMGLTILDGWITVFCK